MQSLLNTLLLIVALAGAFPSILAGNPVSPVAYGDALADAMHVAAMNPQWQVLRCDGDSMTPYFGANSLMLVESAKTADLSPGMIAVYRDATGELVAHIVVKQDANGATLRGYNNSRNDPEVVTDANLVGVVFGLIHGAQAGSEGAELPVAMGKRF